MYLEKLPRLVRTLAFRLALWYALIFTISSFVTFLVLHVLISSALRERTDQQLLTEVAELASHLVLEGLHAVELDIVEDAEANGVDRMFLRILTSDGQELFSSNMSAWTRIAVSDNALKRVVSGRKHVFETLTNPQSKQNVRILYGIIGPDRILQIGKSLEDDEGFMMAFRERFIKLMAGLMVLGGLIGWFMAKRALLDLEEVSKTAEDISKGEIEKRVPLKARGAEIDRLARTFNSMLDRIHSLIQGMREITDNIAHDLRSPITRIRGIAEMTVTTGNSLDEYQSMAANTIEECDRLLEMIETMLDISELDAGAGNLAMAELDLAKVVEDACELFQPLAEDKGVTINAELPKQAWVYGDVHRLQRMVSNLLDNAIKYTPTAGTVTVCINGDQDQVILAVKDNGIGISSEELSNIFERFYRCEPSRPDTGVGLGLSLVMAIARSHGGDIAASSYPGKGSSFTVSLPRNPLAK